MLNLPPAALPPKLDPLGEMSGSEGGWDSHRLSAAAISLRFQVPSLRPLLAVPMVQVARGDNAQPDSRLALHGDVVYCSHLVKVEEPVAGYPVRIPVAPEVARRAMDLVRQFPGCFWFWKEEPSISFRDDVESVIRNLRQYGDKSAWSAAQELRQCL